MIEKTIEFESLSLPFTVEADKWRLNLAKSQTRLTDVRQTRMLTKAPTDTFVPVDVEDDDDALMYTFTVDPNWRTWQDLGKLHRNEKLRLLCNVAMLRKYISARLTFFLHPDNLVFDDNLQPLVIYRGVRALMPPFDMDEQHFLKQLKCLSLALLYDRHSFDQLYQGDLANANETEFERRVSGIHDLDELVDFLTEQYQQEQQKAEKTMRLLPLKRFRLFKQLSISMIVIAILLATPLVYLVFFDQPYKQRLLDADKEYLADDGRSVIDTLEQDKAEKLPKPTKFILARSYIDAEHLSEDEKQSVLKNVSLKSDDDYLLYWIFNGRGELEDALDKAKYLNDPTLILYGLAQKIQDVQDDADLDGSERDEKLKKLKDDLDKRKKEYGLDDDKDNQTNEDKQQSNQDEQEKADNDQKEKSKDASDDKKDKAKQKEKKHKSKKEKK